MSMNGSQPFVTIKFEFFYAFYLRPSLASFLLPIFFFFLFISNPKLIEEPR